MTRTCPIILKAIPPIIMLLTVMAFPAFAGDIQALIKNVEGAGIRKHSSISVSRTAKGRAFRRTTPNR